MKVLILLAVLSTQAGAVKLEPKMGPDLERSTFTATTCLRTPASGSTFAAGCGGTGVTASTLSVSGNAFSVGGSTLVASGGNVGIGTTSPGHKLAVSTGTISTTGNGVTMVVDDSSNNPVLYLKETGATKGTIQTASGLLYLDGAAGITMRGNALGHHLRIASGGNVGIGTTSPAARFHTIDNAILGNDALTSVAIGTPTAPTVNTLAHLFVGGASILGQNATDGEHHLMSNAYYNTGWKRRINDDVMDFNMNNGTMTFSWSGGGAADSAISFSELLRIQPNGNVGIGTTAPGYKLVVQSGSVAITSGTIAISGTGSPTTGGALCLNASNLISKCTSVTDASGNCTCP